MVISSELRFAEKLPSLTTDKSHNDMIFTTIRAPRVAARNFLLKFFSFIMIPPVDFVMMINKKKLLSVFFGYQPEYAV